MAQVIQSNITLILSIAQLVTLAYALYRFTRKPHDSLEERVKSIEKRVDKLEEHSEQGEDKFKKIEKALNVLIHSSLSLIEFEIQYCLTEHKDMSDGLKESKKALHDFLAEK